MIPPTPNLVITEEVKQLVQRAEAGDTSVLPELRRLLTEVPELWQQYGDLALHAEKTWIRLAAGPNAMLQECLERKLAELQQELGRDEAPPLEQILIRRIAASWLQTEYLDAHAGQMQARGSGPALLKLASVQLSGAQQRLLQAIKGLALVRKLLRPAPAPVEIARRLEGNSQATSKRPTGGRFAEVPAVALN